MEPRTRLIVALDVEDREEALHIASALSGEVDAIKVNYPLVLGAGLGIVTELAALAPVICDFKIADIPFTNGLIAAAVDRAGAQGLIVHGFVGEDSVRAVVDAFPREVFIVTEMSHPGAVGLTRETAMDMVDMGLRCGVAGFIAPGTRPHRIQAIRERAGDKLILSPGIGAQGGTPKEAVVAGADFLIVGRSIYQAEDPAAAARSIVERMEG